MIIVLPIAAVAVLIVLVTTFRSVGQANVAVVTMFGKYRRILRPGLNVLVPFFERIVTTVPIQNQTSQLKFSAITSDQAAVHFTATIIYTVSDHDEETVKLVAFKFVDKQSFTTALNSAVDASIRAFVATKRQAEILGVRQAIVDHAKETLGEQLTSWGYLISDLQLNDVAFDTAVMASMSQIVEAQNLKLSATAKGEALLIERTKAAEAEGAAIRISAENEAKAAQLRGEGLAGFRKAIATGLAESADVLDKNGLDEGLLAFSMWTETIRDAAREGTGNTIFLDGNISSMEDTMRRTQAIVTKK